MGIRRSVRIRTVCVLACLAPLWTWGIAPEDTPLFWGAIGRDASTVSVTVGERVAQGVVMKGDQCLSGLEFEGLGTLDQVTIVYDTPWAPSQENKFARDVRIGVREVPGDRLARLKKEWEARYVFVESKDGIRPIAREEVDLARRSEESAVGVYRRMHPRSASRGLLSPARWTPRRSRRSARVCSSCGEGTC